MSTLLPAKRRAEKFAALVDATSSTGADEPYAPLLEVVGALRAAAESWPATGRVPSSEATRTTMRDARAPGIRHDTKLTD